LVSPLSIAVSIDNATHIRKYRTVDNVFLLVKQLRGDQGSRADSDDRALTTGEPGSYRWGMSKVGILVEFWQFLRHSKKWWLTPIVAVLLMLSLLIVLTESSVLAPFIYSLF